MELVLNRPLVREFNDRTQSKRPPREALSPPTAGSFLSRMMVASHRDRQAAPLETLPLLAFWGD